MSDFNLAVVPKWRRGYRFQFEPLQKQHVLLYPEGMIKLNDSAAAISALINGTDSVDQIVAQLKQQFGDLDAIEHDVVDYMRVAEQQHWIELHG